MEELKRLIAIARSALWSLPLLSLEAVAREVERMLS